MDVQTLPPDRLPRRLWAAAEAIHAVTYFHSVCTGAMARLGARGFWMGYFVGRMAPLGAIGPDLAEAVAFGFSPQRPHRALPDGWLYLSPGDAVRARVEAAGDALEDLGMPEPSAGLLHFLENVRAGAPTGGRPLGAANRTLALHDEPRHRAWQLVTWLREHRGDEHIALWVANGFDGCEANVLTTAIHRQGPAVLRDARAWSREDWAAAARRLTRRGLLTTTEQGGLAATDDGRGVHAAIEGRTDDLTQDLYRDHATATELSGHMDELAVLARAVVASGVYPAPNPMGLPIPAAPSATE